MLGQSSNCSVPVGTITASGTLCYNYDNAGNLTSYQDAGGQVTYGYNSLDEVTTLTEPGSPGAQTSFGYDNDHRRTTTTYPVNVTQTVTYDASGRVSTVQATSGSTTLTNFTYTYTLPNSSPAQDTDVVYQIRENDTQRNVTTYQTFDLLNRLTGWCVMAGTAACNPTPPNYVHD